MSVCCECFLLSGRGFCFGLITRPEESYIECGASEFDREASTVRRPWPTGGYQALLKRIQVKGSLFSMKQHVIKVYGGMDV